MLKTRNTILLGAALTFASLASSASAATGHLICRGNPDSEVSMNSVDNAAGDVAIYWGFEKYPGPKSGIKADGAHLAPGQCSWHNALITGRYLQQVTYFVNPSQLWMVVHMRDDISQAGADNFGWFAYGRRTADKNLMWLPVSTLSNHNKGSIFDSGMVFHFYVNIVNDLELMLYKTTWGAYPYQGR
jgi:hypothetical protein